MGVRSDVASTGREMLSDYCGARSLDSRISGLAPPTTEHSILFSSEIYDAAFARASSGSATSSSKSVR